MVDPMRDVIVTSVRGFLERLSACAPARWQRLSSRFVDSLSTVLFYSHIGKDTARSVHE